MITVKCYYENGETITTEINATLEEATKYFVGSVFNVGLVEDNLQRCIRIEQIN